MVRNVVEMKAEYGSIFIIHREEMLTRLEEHKRELYYDEERRVQLVMF